MNWKRTFLATLALGLVLIAAPASASVFTSSLSFDGLLDELQDNSVAVALFDFGPLGVPDGVIGPGDIIGGVIKLNTNISDGADIPDTVHILFSAKVLSGPTASTNRNGGDAMLNFLLGPVPAADPGATSIAELLPTKDLTYSFSDDTIGVFLTKTGGDNQNLTGFATAVSNLDGAGWAVDMTFGFVKIGAGEENTQGGKDYFEAEMRDHLLGASAGQISITDADSDGYIDEYDLLLSGNTTGLESGAFSVLLQPGMPGAVFLPVSVEDLGGTAPSKNTVADLVLYNSTVLKQPTNRGVDNQVANGWIFADQSDIGLNATPEPASLLVWGGLMGAVAVAGIIRRQRARA